MIVVKNNSRTTGKTERKNNLCKISSVGIRLDQIQTVRQFDGLCLSADLAEYTCLCTRLSSQPEYTPKYINFRNSILQKSLIRFSKLMYVVQFKIIKNTLWFFLNFSFLE